MYRYVCNIALGALPVDRAGTVDVLVWFLCVLGAILIVAVPVAFSFLPPDLIEKINQKTHFKWSEHRYLHIGFLQLVFVAGLAFIGAGIWLKARSDLPDPSRVLNNISVGLESLDEKTAALDDRSTALISKTEVLSTGLDAAQQKVDKATKAAMTLVLRAPTGVVVHLYDVSGDRVLCHYQLSSDPEVHIVQSSSAPTEDAIKCRIENISPPAVIMRITVEEVPPSQIGRPRYIGYYTGVDPAVPNYDLKPCPQNCPQ